MDLLWNKQEYILDLAWLSIANVSSQKASVEQGLHLSSFVHPANNVFTVVVGAIIFWEQSYFIIATCRITLFRPISFIIHAMAIFILIITIL
jgi:hypothetical protein